MKVTFLIPPSFTPGVKPAERSAGCTRIVYPFPNLYELQAAAVVEKNGYEVALKDFIYHSDSAEDFERFLKDDKSDVYVIWGVNLSIEDDLKAISLIKKHTGAKVVMLGPSATFFPEKFLEACPEVVIVRGEPEESLLELLNYMSEGKDFSQLRGLTISRDGKIQRNPARPLIKDLDSLPFPARHLLGNREYHNPKLKTGPYTTALTSRNCPYQCIYCVPSSLTFARELDYKADHKDIKPPIGFRSVESVDAEMKMLHEQGYKAICFVDDNFIWNEERTEALCNVMRKYGMVWGCQARADAITEKIAKCLGESGCRYVDIGMESFDDEILKYVRKGITSKDIYRSVELLQKYNVPVKLNILIGTSPLETKKTIRDTIRKAKRIGADQVMVNIISPFPGTKFYNQAIDNGWIEGGQYRPTNVQRESILNYPHLSAKDMEKLLFRSNLSFFLDPRFVWKQIRRFRSPKEFFLAAKALKVKLFG